MSVSFWANGFGQQTGRGLRERGRRGAPCASMPTASTTESGPRPPVSSISVGGEVVDLREVDDLGAARLRQRQALGHEVDADDAFDAEVPGDPHRHLADRAETEDGEGAAGFGTSA